VIDQAYVQAGLAGLTASIESLEDLAERLPRLPLANQPGTRWRYSYATDVLARLIEVWSGERFSAFISRRILEPLGMVDTAFYVAEDKRDRFTAMYAPTNVFKPMEGGLVKVDDPYETRYATPPDWESGGHGLVSTVADYLAFVKMLVSRGEWAGRRYLQPETLELMRTNQLPPGENVQFGMRLPGVTFGLGFGLQEELPDGMSALAQDEYHWGGIAGTHSWMAPRADLALICMVQRMPGFLHPFQADFKRLTYAAVERG
jgi:CubicO group peptidase (beta-lactamase class C family)